MSTDSNLQKMRNANSRAHRVSHTTFQLQKTRVKPVSPFPALPRKARDLHQMEVSKLGPKRALLT